MGVWWLAACLSERKLMKGAIPVPGPIRTTGVSRSEGNFKVPFFTV